MVTRLGFRTYVCADGLKVHEVIKRGDVFIVVKDSLSSVPGFAATSQVPFGLPPHVSFMHMSLVLFASVVVIARIYTKVFIY